MTHALEHWGDRGPSAADSLDSVALEARLAEARARRDKTLAKRQVVRHQDIPPVAVQAPIARVPYRARRRRRVALVTGVFLAGLAAGAAAVLLGPSLSSRPAVAPLVILGSPALAVPLAAPASPQPHAAAPLAIPSLPNFDTLALVLPALPRPAPRPALLAVPMRVLTAEVTSATGDMISRGSVGLFATRFVVTPSSDPGLAIPADFRMTGKPAAARTALAFWPPGLPYEPPAAKPRTPPRSNGPTETTRAEGKPLGGLFGAIGRLFDRGNHGNGRR